MLDNLRGGPRDAVNKVAESGAVDGSLARQPGKDIRKAPIMSGVQAQMVVDTTGRLEARALKEAPPPALSRKGHLVKMLYDGPSGLLGRQEQEDGDRSERICRGRMTLTDFLNEVAGVKGAGSMRDVVDGMPAFAAKMKDGQIDRAGETAERRRHIIRGMAGDGWTNPDVLSRSRIRRMARGSGWPEHDVGFMIKSNMGRRMQGMLRRTGLG